jgi:uncharacterized protein YybS (DUF2232 family)
MEPKPTVEEAQQVTLTARQQAARQAAEEEVQAELDLLRESIGAATVLTPTPLVEEVKENEEAAPKPVE